MKKALREIQTLRAGCSKAEPKIFAQRQTPFPGARDGQNIIRPNIIWSPYTARDIDAVESVQRRFTKRLPTLRNMSYNDRLRYLNIPSLELRRLHTDLFWCYKVVLRLVLVI